MGDQQPPDVSTKSLNKCMKLQQLFEYEFPKITHRKVTKLPDNVYNRGEGTAHNYDPGFVPKVLKRSAGVEHLGTGHFASAYSHKDRPQDVRKVSRQAQAYGKGGAGVDGFYHYMKELSNHEDNSNPYFPKFRGITIYEDPDGGIVYSAQMERLFPMRKLRRREKVAVLEKMLGDREEAGVSEFTSISSVIREVIQGYDIKNHVVDEELIKAAEFINHVAKKHKIGNDIHDDNIMIRRSPYGSQVVITDPLSFQQGGVSKRTFGSS